MATGAGDLDLSPRGQYLPLTSIILIVLRGRSKVSLEFLVNSCEKGGEKMKRTSVSVPAVIVILFSWIAGMAYAENITPKMQQKIDAYKKKAVEWAANPTIIKAVKESNAKGPIPGMGNAKWREVKETDSLVQGFITSPAGQQMTQWMNADAKGINKIVLSGDKSHRVAFTSMPAIYIGKGKPNFDEAIGGKVWQQDESKPDPSTNIDTVQIAAPVKDGGKTIGVLLVSLTVANLK